jgi:hypothetical protein
MLKPMQQRFTSRPGHAKKIRNVNVSYPIMGFRDLASLHEIFQYPIQQPLPTQEDRAYHDIPSKTSDESWQYSLDIENLDHLAAVS